MKATTQIQVAWPTGSSAKNSCFKVCIRRAPSPGPLSAHELWCLLRMLAEAELANTPPSPQCGRSLHRAVDQPN